MQIIFTIEAKQYLEDLRAFLRPLSPSGLANVTRRLEECILPVPDFPKIGRPTPRAEVREVIETRYGFVIPYYFKGGNLYILRVYRTARKPLDYAAIKLP